jgi:ribosome recycling factor
MADVLKELRELLDRADGQMKTARDSVRQRLAKLRTGKASPALLDSVRIESYGTLMPLNQLASIAAPEARLLTVKPFDRNLIAAIEKAIRASDLGLNPNSDGQLIRVPIPELTEERRREYGKLGKEIGEEHKVAVRKARQDANDRLKKMEKDGGVPEDALQKARADVQKMTDRYVGEIDEIVKAKETEIMGL